MEREDKAIAEAAEVEAKPKSNTPEKRQSYGPEKPPWMIKNEPNPHVSPNLQPKKISKQKKLVEDSSQAVAEPSTTHVEDVQAPDQAISIPELLELQLLAGDDDESDFDPGENWEYNEEDYGDDDDESEDEFGRTRGSLFPFALPATIQKSIDEKRNKSTSTNVDLPKAPSTLSLNTSKQHVVSSFKDKGKGKVQSKRRVTFSEEISVREFEKDPPEVHGNINPMQGFMKAVLEAQQEQTLKMMSEPKKTNENENRTGLSRVLSVEEELLQKLYPDDDDAEDMVQPITDDNNKSPKVSRFKAARMAESKNDTIESKATFGDFAVSSSIIERAPVSTIIERDSPVSSTIIERDVPISSTIIERDSPVKSAKRLSVSGTIIERESGQATPIVTPTSKPRVSRFKAQKQPPVSTRIQELSPEEVLKEEEKIKVQASSFTNVSRYPSTFTSKPIKEGQQLEEAKKETREETHRGVETLRPGLASGMRSLFPADVLAKADEYYQQSLLTEEQFIRAHLGNEDEQEESEIIAERERFLEEEKQAILKKNEYKNRPVMEEELVEKPVAPYVSGRGMGFVPDEYLHDDEDDDDDDEDDYTVNRAEIAREYQKIRQSLIYQTGGYGQSLEELEVEPIDEEGNIRKVSRFKAARLSTRRS